MKQQFNNSKLDPNDGLITEKQFKDLAMVHHMHCISIYLPTSRVGEEHEIIESQIRLKNIVTKVRNSLQKLDVSENEISDRLKQLNQIHDDKSFWRKQSDGLVILMNTTSVYYFTLPIHFEEFIYISDHFYLKPIVPFFNDDGKFYILCLSLQNIRFYECSRDYITEMHIEDLTPERLEDVVGYDFREKSLQHRTGQGGEAGAMFHGHGAGKDDKKEEIEKFFRAVDEGLMKILHNDDAPLIMACVDHYYPIYKGISNYSNIYEKHISGNPDNANIFLLHEKAWHLIQDYFRQERLDKIRQIRDLSATGRTSYKFNDILIASVDGRIDTLFVQHGADTFGIYDETRREIIHQERPDLFNVSLYNMAVVHTIINGGKVFESIPGEMPYKDSRINALYRY